LSQTARSDRDPGRVEYVARAIPDGICRQVVPRHLWSGAKKTHTACRGENPKQRDHRETRCAGHAAGVSRARCGYRAPMSPQGLRRPQTCECRAIYAFITPRGPHPATPCHACAKIDGPLDGQAEMGDAAKTWRSAVRLLARPWRTGPRRRFRQWQAEHLPPRLGTRACARGPRSGDGPRRWC
jgi:hypothetical protein